jgi:hypothetical protein
MSDDDRTTDPAGSEEIDIELEEPRPRGGRGAWFVIVLLIVLAALAWFLFQALEQAKERAAQEKADRARHYQAVQRTVGQDLGGALAALEEGDVGAVVSALQAASKDLGTLAAEADGAKDADEASQIRMTARQVDDALAEIETMHDELVGLARDRVATLQQAMGVQPTEQEPPEEEAVEEPEVTAEEAPEATPKGTAEPQPIPEGKPGVPREQELKPGL